MRQQIATELRGHIAERLAGGHTVDEVLALLGDPVHLAESLYLASVPLVSARFWPRVLAKVVDIATIGAGRAAAGVAGDAARAAGSSCPSS